MELVVRSGASQRELQLSPQHRKRRSQLVACVGDEEESLVLEGGLEPLEHLVQRRGET